MVSQSEKALRVKARRMKANGSSVEEIAAKLKTSVEGVKKLLEPYDMIAVIRAAKARRAKIRAWRKRKWSMADIAQELGVSRGMAQKLVQKAEAESAGG